MPEGPEQFERILRHEWIALASTIGVVTPALAITQADWDGFSRGIPPHDPFVAHSILEKYGVEDAEPSTLQKLLRQSEWVDLPAGSILLRKGASADCVYKLITGKAQVFLIQPDGSRRLAGTIGPGELIGEIEFVTNSPFQAEIRAIRDLELVRIPRAALLEAAQSDPGLWEAVARAAVGHMERLIAGEPSTPISRVVTVVPAGCDIDRPALAKFCEKLTNSFHQRESAQWISSDQVDRELGVGAAQNGGSRLREYMAARESASQRLVLQCDTELTPWTKRCLAQADRILFAACGSSPELNSIELASAGRRDRKDLVFLADSTAGDWVATRAVETVHYSGDMHRLVRFLSGRAQALVLGGGGARGFAHIGVIRAMQELGMSIDAAGGTSMGSCIAALCAMGLTWKEILERSREAWVRRRPLRDYTIPLVSLVSGRRLDNALRWMFGETRIEDLPIPYYSVSSNLVDGRVVSHRQGLLRRAVRSSTSVPGIFPPVTSPGSLLVDGGVLNNLPVDIMRAFAGTRHIIAVDVNPYGSALLAGCPEYGDSLTGWKAIGHRLRKNGTRQRIPDIHAILERATMLGSIKSTEENSRQVEIYLRPPTDDFGFLEVEKIDKIVEAGYRFARTEFEARLQR